MNPFRRSIKQNLMRCSRALTPPMRQQPSRGFITFPKGQEAAVVGSIITANVAVWAGWQYAESNSWKLYQIMQENFTVSRSLVPYKPHTLITAAFSQKSGYHLLGNMMTLFFFGPSCVAAIGARTFMSLYMGSGIFANICHVVSTRDPRQPALGASGALNAVVAYSILMNPTMLIVVFAEFIPIPMPAILYGGVFIGRDVAALFDTELTLPFGLGRSFTQGNVAHAAHVGGAVCGAAYFLASRGRGGGSGPWRRLR
mmetsp:Transcript_50164/g.85900  ORF Transcript_50164/g.85900 Transcript_50164/m.85900 type:complete len:256 (+) Transcript_50164:133-900(+)